MSSQRIGERNGRAKLTDAQVEEMRRLREDEIVVPGKRRHWTNARLAQRFGITKRAVIYILNFERRSGVPDEW